MANEEAYLDGHLVERITDNGDGTGTRTTWADDGTELGTDLVARPVPTGDPPALPDLLASIDPAAARAAITAGALLVARAGDLWEALTEVADTNTARAAIEIVTDVALQAALTEGEGAP